MLMPVYAGNSSSKFTVVKIDRGLSHVNITDADIRTGKLSINNKGEKIIGASTERFLQSSTKDATALSKDINPSKTGYVDGVKLVGSYTDMTLDSGITGNIVSYPVKSDITNAGDFVKFTKYISGKTLAGTSDIELLGTGSTQYIQTVVLDSDKFLVFYRNNTNYGYGEVSLITVSGNTLTKVRNTVFADVNTQYISAVSIDKNKVLVTYVDGNNSLSATGKVVSVDSSNNILVGPAYVINDRPTSDLATVQLFTDRVMVAYTDVNSRYGFACIVTITNDAIITTGRKVFNYYRSYDIKLSLLDNTRVIATCKNYDGSDYGQARVLVISADNTFTTPGNDFTFYGSRTEFHDCIVLDSSRVLVAFRRRDDSIGVVQLMNINNATISSTGSRVTFSSNYASNIHLALVGKDKVLLTYNNGNTTLQSTARIVTVSSNTVTVGTDETIFVNNPNGVLFDASLLDIDKVVSVYNNEDDTSAYATLIQVNEMTPSNQIYEYIYSTDGVMAVNSVYDTVAGIALTSGVNGDMIDIKVPN